MTPTSWGPLDGFGKRLAMGRTSAIFDPRCLPDVRISLLVGPTLEDGLRALREATELAKLIAIELDDAYLANIARVEARPENQSGADKSWVWRMDSAFRSTMRNATRVR